MRRQAVDRCIVAACEVAAVGPLDLDDARPEVGEMARGERRRDRLLNGDDGDVFKRKHYWLCWWAANIFLFAWGPTIFHSRRGIHPWRGCSARSRLATAQGCHALTRSGRSPRVYLERNVADLHSTPTIFFSNTIWATRVRVHRCRRGSGSSKSARPDTGASRGICARCRSPPRTQSRRASGRRRWRPPTTRRPPAASPCWLRRRTARRDRTAPPPERASGPPARRSRAPARSETARPGSVRSAD